MPKMPWVSLVLCRLLKMPIQQKASSGSKVALLIGLIFVLYSCSAPLATATSSSQLPQPAVLEGASKDAYSPSYNLLLLLPCTGVVFSRWLRLSPLYVYDRKLIMHCFASTCADSQKTKMCKEDVLLFHKKIQRLQSNPNTWILYIIS